MAIPEFELICSDLVKEKSLPLRHEEKVERMSGSQADINGYQKVKVLNIWGLKVHSPSNH